MSAPHPLEPFDDGFDVDMDFSEAAAAFPGDSGRSPLQFTPPASAVQTAAQPVMQAPTQNTSAPGFNPVGDLLAQAQSTLAPTTDAGPAPSSAVPSALAPSGLAPAGLAAVGSIGEVSVPRIAIHVFAERQDTLAAAERAAQDRRLSRATTQIRIGGIMAAVETRERCTICSCGAAVGRPWR